MSPQRHLPGWEPSRPEAAGYWTQQPAQSHTLRNVAIGCSAAFGGCAVLVILAIVGLAVIGSRLPPSSNPSSSRSTMSCAPQPCATFQGVTVVITNIDRY